MTYRAIELVNYEKLILNYFDTLSLINSLISRRNQKIFIFITSLALALEYWLSKNKLTVNVCGDFTFPY